MQANKTITTRCRNKVKGVGGGGGTQPCGRFQRLQVMRTTKTQSSPIAPLSWGRTRVLAEPFGLDRTRLRQMNKMARYKQCLTFLSDAHVNFLIRPKTRFCAFFLSLTVQKRSISLSHQLNQQIDYPTMIHKCNGKTK